MKKPTNQSAFSPRAGLLGRAVVLAALGLFTPACGSLFDDRLASICECENCGDREQQEYEIINQTEVDIADTYECGELLDAYWECNLQAFECNDGRYRDDNSECGRELDEYGECKRARSSRDPGPY